MDSGFSADSDAYDILCLCARRHLDPAGRANLAKLTRNVDARALIDLAEYHRLTMVLALHLAALGEDVRADLRVALSAAASKQARNNLGLTAELVKISAAFAEADIPFIPYKGPLLALAAWGDLSLRPFVDLDLLIDPVDLARAASLLRERGYSCRYDFSGGQNAVFMALDGDYPFMNESGSLIELHVRIASERFAIPMRTRDLFARCKTTVLAGRTVRTLAIEDLVLVLCMHGSKHRWGALGWLADLAQIIRAETVDWDTL